jgi:hypothetical protein
MSGLARRMGTRRQVRGVGGVARVVSLLGQNFTRSGEGSYLTAAPGDGTTAFLAWAATDALRLEDRGDGAGALVLLERADTCRAIRNAEFDNATWVNYSGWTKTAGIANGPDGSSLTADRLSVVAAGGTPRQLRQVIAAPADNTRITISCWVKTEAGTAKVRLTGTDEPGNANNSADITVTTTWQWVSFTYNYGSSGGAPFAPEVGFINASTQEAATILAWGYQAEFSRAPSSSIRTAAATVERGADTLTLASTPSWLLTGAARFAQASPNFANADLVSGDVRWLFTVGSSSDGVRIRHNGTDIRVEAVQGGAVKAQSAAQTLTRYALLGAVRWDPAAATVSVGGVSGAAGTPWTWTTGTVRVGGIQGGSGDEGDCRFSPTLEAA